MTAPVIPYFGSKTTLAPWILEHVGSPRVWVDGCFGSGAVTFAKSPSPVEIANDLSGDMVTFFRVLRDCPSDLARVCGLSPHAREEWMSATLDDDLDDLERARRVWVRLNQSFSQTLSPRSGWRWSTEYRPGIPSTIASRIGHLEAAAVRLANVTFECRPVADLLGDMVGRLSSNDVVYLDPPYPASTRSNAGGAGYQVEMSDDDHRAMAAVAARLDCRVLVSSYPSELYADLFDGWWSIERPVKASTSNSRRTSRGGRVEVLWSNHPLETPQMTLGFG